MEFGVQVRRLRAAAGRSREELAESAGLSLNYVRSIEAGERDPSLSTVIALAKGLGVTPADLVGPTTPLSPGALQVARLYELQPKPVQRAVLELLRAVRRPR